LLLVRFTNVGKPIALGLVVFLTLSKTATSRTRTVGECMPHPSARCITGQTTGGDSTLSHVRRLNLVTVQERRRRGQKSLTNIVRIVSPEWTAWIRIGGKKLTTPDKGQKERGFGATWERYSCNYRQDSDAPSRREAVSKRKEEA
jgi:hypothetical protein